MSSLLAQRPLPGSSQGAPATAREMATLHTINQQSGREMLTHLAVIVKQVTAPGADRIWPGGICLQVGCRGLCDLYLGDCAAQGNKSSSLGKNLLKWVRVRFNSFDTSEFWVLLFKRANDILLPISFPCVTSSYNSEESSSIYLSQFNNYVLSPVADNSGIGVRSVPLVHL